MAAKTGPDKGARVVLFHYDGTPDWVKRLVLPVNRSGVISDLYPLNGDELPVSLAEVKPKLVICEDVTWYEGTPRGFQCSILSLQSYPSAIFQCIGRPLRANTFN